MLIHAYKHATLMAESETRVEMSAYSHAADDVVVKRDGAIYFTDTYGGLRLRDKDPRKELPFNAVFLWKSGKLTLLIKDMPATNGYPQTVVFPRDDLMTLVSQGPFGGVNELNGKSDGTRRGVKTWYTTPSYSSCYYTAPYDPELAAKALALLVQPAGRADEDPILRQEFGHGAGPVGNQAFSERARLAGS